MHLSAKQIQAVGWNGHSVSQVLFSQQRALTAGDSCRATGFQTCDNCFVHSLSTNTIRHSQKRYDIIQTLNKYYKPVGGLAQSGLLRIQFVVNCEGEPGLFSIVGFGDDYCPKQFNAQITEQLTRICRTYIATDQSLHYSEQSRDQTIDAAISFTVRLRDGHITDVLP